MSNVIVKDNLAKIAISKNLIKEYKTSESERTVYLNNGTEFQIYLKNPYQHHLGIKIYVNDKSIGNMLVLRPGQTHWLDRFVDNDSRLLFSTYEVDDTPEMGYATAKNGKVRVEFYKERDHVSRGASTCINTKRYNDWDDSDTHIDINSVCTNSVVSECAYSGPTTLYNSLSCSNDLIPCSSGIISDLRFEIDKSATKTANVSTKETGRIEKGSKSDQKFEVCDIDFDSWSFQTENIQILPTSRKQVRAEETRRKYCSQCGSKVSPKDKFCSNCGAKLK